jgi:hypothetical protein
VPLEMLAAGCLPVVNDGEHTRCVLDNPYVAYASADPHSIAMRLETVVNSRDWESISRAASATARAMHWDQAGATVESIFCRVVSQVRDTQEVAQGRHVV